MQKISISRHCLMQNNRSLNAPLLHPSCPYQNNSELLICTTNDSRTVGMPISFMCACVKFVIYRSSQFCNLQRTWQCRGEDAKFDVFTITEAICCANQKLPICLQVLGHQWFPFPQNQALTYNLSVSVSSGIATGGQGGQSATPDSKKFAKNREKEGENWEKRGKLGRKRQKSGRFFHFAPPDR